MKTRRRNGIVVWSLVAASLGSLGVLLTAPDSARAQARVGVSVEWWDWIGDVRVHPPASPPVRPRIREERGPPFCRSGRGHPVHGWSWCVRKGFARPHRVRRAPAARRPVACCVWSPWARGEIRFLWRGGDRFDRRLGESEVVRILGRGVVDDLYATAGYRRDAPLRARWHPSTGGARVLQVRAGAVPLAEFTDLDGDRRVDRAFVARPEAGRR